jgi:hypothetical protein
LEAYIISKGESSEKGNAPRTVSGFATHLSRKGGDREDVEIHAGDDDLCGYGH